MSEIVIAGLRGAVLGPFICRLFRIKDSVAVGVAIGIAGLITVFLVPLLLYLFGYPF